jgi:hypothetical protein
MKMAFRKKNFAGSRVRLFVLFLFGFLVVLLILGQDRLKGAFQTHLYAETTSAMQADRIPLSPDAEKPANGSLAISETPAKTGSDLKPQQSREDSTSDPFAGEVNGWLSEITVRGDILKPAAARKMFETLSDEYETIKTMQGRLILQFDEEPPVFDGEVYIRQTETAPNVKRSHPWRYEIRLKEGSATGWNLVTHTDLKGWENPISWREGEQQNEQAPSNLVQQLAYIPLSPVMLIRVLPAARDAFFKQVITNIHQTQPEEETGLEGGPFWVFDRVDTQRWLSKDGELRRVRGARRFPEGGGFDIDKTFDKYQVIEGVRYPTVLTTELTATGPSGRQYIKDFTGRESDKVKFRVLLSDLQLNRELPESLFKRPEG